MIINWFIRLLIFGVIPLMLCSCEDKNEYNTRVKITVENLSEYDLDSLRILCRTWHDLENIVFYDIKSGAISEQYEAMNLNFELFFRAYLDGDSISQLWVCPYKAIDPAFYAIPSGYYNFGILECDTVKEKLIIGLIEYY